MVAQASVTPRLLGAAECKKAGDYVEGDHPTAGATSSTSTYAPPPAPHVIRPQKQLKVTHTPPQFEFPAGRGAGAPAQAWADNSEHDGSKWVKAKSGLRLCPWFQRGQCGATAAGNRCPYDDSMVHQCEKCLRTGHGGDGHDKQGKGGAGGWGAAPIKQKITKGGKKDKGAGKGGKKHKKGGWSW